MPHSRLTFTNATEALDFLLPTLQKVPENTLLALCTTSTRVWEQTRQLHTQLAPLLVLLEEHFAPTRVQDIKRRHGRIELLALAYHAADCNREEYEFLRQSGAIRALEFQIGQGEQMLSRAVQTLLSNYETPLNQALTSHLIQRGQRHFVLDSLALAQLLEAHWHILESSHLSEALRIYGLQLASLRSHIELATRWLKARPTLDEVAESTKLCHQAYTLFCQTFDDLSRVGRYLAPDLVWPPVDHNRPPIYVTSQGVSA